MNILDFKHYKSQKLSMVTCYDYWSAALINQTDIDCVLIGDSLAMVMHGHETTLPASTNLIAQHTRAVARGCPKKWLIADMPFLSYRKSLTDTMTNVEMLMQAGAHSVKIEGVSGHETTLKHIIESGIPVMGHLGLTPQAVHQLGGFKVQGKNSDAQQQLLDQAKKLEQLGAYAIVLECIPGDLAKTITQSIAIPTIGIGAGSEVNGQVLVLQDLLGLNEQFKPKFVKHYLPGAELVKQALQDFVHEIKHQDFPTAEHTFR